MKLERQQRISSHIQEMLDSILQRRNEGTHRNGWANYLLWNEKLGTALHGMQRVFICLQTPKSYHSDFGVSPRSTEF